MGQEADPYEMTTTATSRIRGRSVMRVWTLAILSMMMLAGCASPATEPGTPDQIVEAVHGDPMAVGNLTSTLVDWELPPFVADGSSGKYPIQFHGEATIPDGDGPYPLAIFMHGRHSTCRYLDTTEFLGQPCPRATPVMEPVDSYTGYRYLAENLASHGIAVISVSANDVNDYDLAFGLAGDDSGATARGRLILELLDEVAAAQAGADNDLSSFADKLDLERVGLMGHSRGGEGVIRAATLAPERIDAVMALAPTDFARWVMPSRVAFGTILPYCDGDVSNLQGAWAYDDMAFGTKHQFLDMGANHNFYNTIWTGDDWGAGGDPYCGSESPDSGRLSPEEQQAHGLAIMGSFFRYYLAGEPFEAMLEGRADFPMYGVHTSYVSTTPHAPAFTIMDASGADAWLATGARPCDGTSCPIPETYSTAKQFHARPGVVDGIETQASHKARDPVDVSGAFAMTLRIGIHQDADPAALADLQLHLGDADGNTASWHVVELGAFIPPGDAAAKTTLNMLYIPLAGVEIDLQAVAWVAFTAEAPIEIQYTDWFLLLN